jgi:hypothetical protein
VRPIKRKKLWPRPAPDKYFRGRPCVIDSDGLAEFLWELLKIDFNREGHEEREERKGIKLYFSMNY